MMVQEQGRGSFAQIVGGEENLAAERQELTALGLQQMSQYGQNILAFVDDAVPQSDHSSFHSEQSLSGLMIGIKDIIDTKCHPTQYGSPIYEGYQPKADASVVAKAIPFVSPIHQVDLLVDQLQPSLLDFFPWL
ncbi:MAG: hypothetical protein EBT20_05385 [Alphaproteobacteria bacterium]|nr:hypothetical protein [Alphaproteobacteria bacterium]